MVAGKLLTKAAAPVVEEVVSPFVKRLFQGVKIPPKTQKLVGCLLYTSPSPRDRTRSRMPSSA